jgi:hypothetical protein
MTGKRAPGWYFCEVQMHGPNVHPIISNEQWDGNAFVDADGNPRTDRDFVKVDERRND